VARFIDELKRTHDCGALRSADIGREVVLFGWVANRRDHGSLIFIDLRDREGITQIVFDPEASGASHGLAEQLRGEWVIGIHGKVRSRGEQFSKKEGKLVSAANATLATGEIEVEVLEATVFNKAETPPFAIDDTSDTREDVRLEYRYLDLRRGPLQRALRMRHRVNQAARTYLAGEGCLEIETPFLVKYTPGGARNFLVPARLNPGKFYALAESPQLFKQLFMVAGFEKYFQIVRHQARVPRGHCEFLQRRELRAESAQRLLLARRHCRAGISLPPVDQAQDDGQRQRRPFRLRQEFSQLGTCSRRFRRRGREVGPRDGKIAERLPEVPQSGGIHSAEAR
jgi:aspartyl-tRNA synthetase